MPPGAPLRPPCARARRQTSRSSRDEYGSKVGSVWAGRTARLVTDHPQADNRTMTRTGMGDHLKRSIPGLAALPKGLGSTIERLTMDQIKALGWAYEAAVPSGSRHDRRARLIDPILRKAQAAGLDVAAVEAASRSALNTRIGRLNPSIGGTDAFLIEEMSPTAQAIDAAGEAGLALALE